MLGTRNILPLLIAVTTANTIHAEGYLYIQSNKSIPIYVKVNGQMQQRYSKYYCIASNLKAGPATVDVLFQQNMYPAQTFNVIIPENGKTGYLLTKRDDSFELVETGTGKTIKADKKNN